MNRICIQNYIGDHEIFVNKCNRIFDFILVTFYPIQKSVWLMPIKIALKFNDQSIELKSQKIWWIRDEDLFI